MRAERVPITVASQSLFDLGGFNVSNCNEVLIQAPITNTNIIYFGQHGKEFGQLFNGAAAGLAITSLKNVYVKGTPTDDLIIIVM
jgi:hypothetical protein